MSYIYIYECEKCNYYERHSDRKDDVICDCDIELDGQSVWTSQDQDFDIDE